MPFPPKAPPTQAPAQAPAPGQAPAQHSDLKPNAAHDGNHGAHAPNGHSTPAQQSTHQSALNSGHGAGTGIAPTGSDSDGDNDRD